MSEKTDAQEPAILVLGAGYAGLELWHALERQSHGKYPIRLVDRHPVHVMRTELYELARLSEAEGGVSPWVVPLRGLLAGRTDALLTGTVEEIDLAHRVIHLDGQRVSFRSLAICLGSVPAYYGVPGADTYCHSVYRLSGAQKLAQAIRDALGRRSSGVPVGQLRIVVVGGGSTGTEVAGEIATADWSRSVGRTVRAPQVRLVIGALPFLAGLDPNLIARARKLLGTAGVELLEGVNVRRVERDELELASGARIPFDLAVWAAGVQAPPVVRAIPVEHGRSGRIRVDEHLEVPGHPGVFCVGDVAEFIDSRTHLPIPATAQAAVAEAPVAARNILLRLRGRPLQPFVYRERGVIVAVGTRTAVGRVGGLTLGGRPVLVLKNLVESAERRSARTHARGKRS
ncbi:MAG: FAD-dependent oxidoreductase [Thermoplasmata archaeon]|nr:FAD-dependent oxidoreductase [Thermoplasmata archaeon]